MEALATLYKIIFVINIYDHHGYDTYSRCMYTMHYYMYVCLASVCHELYKINNNE